MTVIAGEMPKPIKRPAGISCQCTFCGEIFGSSNGMCARFCSFCKTAAQRAEQDKKQIEIEKNRKT